MKTLCTAFILLIGTAIFATADELDCLTEQEQLSSSLYARLQAQAYVALERRLQAFDNLKTAAQIDQWQQERKDFFIKQLGGFPDRSPLNAHTVRTIQADGYRIECVIFESQPDHHVTANLYLPADVPLPIPGVVVSSGHSRTAKTADYNQRFGIAMAKNGIAALCFDPIGQGERSQILDQAGQPKFSGTTTEHLLMGVSSTLVGRSTATYRVWDAMRAIDYLAQRPEIDANRIGMTGCSGGGTMTSMVMALDDRVLCAAPACYLTTFQRLIETIGPQDAEQNVYGQIAFGMDQPDYILMRAPKPTLISSTTSDFFAIDGSWENFRQAKRIYGKLGYPERVDLVEIEGNHGVQPQNLATIAYWMKRWLLGKDEPVAVVELSTLPPNELLCTTTGEVLTAFPNERSVFDLNTAVEEELQQGRMDAQSSTAAEELRSQIRQLLGVPAIVELPSPTFEDVGRIERGEYHIDKLVLRRDSRGPLPGLTFHPPTPEDAAYLYLHDSGKMGDAQPDGPIETLVAQGHAVVTVDLSGQGETASGKRDELLTDWKTYYLSYLLGRPLLGIRVEDALAAGDFVAHYQKDAGESRQVHLVGVGQAGIIALHAAALHPDLFASVTVRQSLREWSSLTGQDTPAGQVDSIVHGALRVYDLPDLVRLVGSEKVRFED